ncbi:hypothetical protein ACOCJ7_12690 [Knoellia sp. CPCC 206453]|uniref:hypothetical protein n=1 Tax=Knoellia pratensis TaxID=3404796 RepID=UPI0036094FE9
MTVTVGAGAGFAVTVTVGAGAGVAKTVTVVVGPGLTEIDTLGRLVGAAALASASVPFAPPAPTAVPIRSAPTVTTPALAYDTDAFSEVGAIRAVR